jgi:hypothetical protein
MRHGRWVALACAFVTIGACNCGQSGEPRGAPCPYEGGEQVANEGWQHVQSEDEIEYDHNPPASGPHFPQWASYEEHDEVVHRGNWVHSIEHGAIVLLIGDDATDDEIATMHAAYEDIPDDEECGHRRTVLTRDPLLDSHMAAVARDIVLEGRDLSRSEIVEFAVECRNRGNEDICY